jgi:membrane-associated phospholipid phosphatase
VAIDCGMLRELDIAIFKLANAFHAPMWDALMVMGSQFGLYNGWMVAMPLVMVLAAVRLKNLPRAQWMHAFVPYAAALACLAVGYWLVIPLAEMIKDWAHMPRPYALLPATEVVRVDTQLSPDSAMRSFPSGHSAVAGTLLVAFGALSQPIIRRVVLFIAAWIMFSRMALGVHFPSDVLGGFLLAVLCTLPVRMVVQMLGRRFT